MPRVKFDYVVSFSNEDSENPANNLLAHEVSKRKWLCNAGEPSCSVVLQLTHAVQISTVHIGAYHAALVEVLVGRSETPNDQYEVLVPSSVFLSPMDSRRGTGVERVRSFSAEQLASARTQKWDRVRVVCSQPYNKHCKYGLSFVHVFETEDKRDPSPRPSLPAVPARVALLGNYSSDEDDFRPGELFAKHRQSGEGIKNTDAQIRQASSQALRNITDSATKLVKTPIAKTNSNRPNQASDFNTSRQRDTLMYTDDDERPHAKIDSIVQRHKDEKDQETKKKEAVQNLFKKKNEKANILQAASKNFKEFLDDKDDKRNSSSSRSKEIPRDDNSRENERKRDLNNSTSSRNGDGKNNDNLNSSRSKEREIKGSKDHSGNSTNRDRSGGNDRRNRDDGNPSQSRTKAEAGPSGDRDNRKRQRSDDRQKDNDVLRAGPITSSPHTLLSGVVFALSGYENPRRARLRDAAAAMGARFERDWNPRCTHLVCAFPNTPKLRTVRSQGADCIAVLGEWVERCCGTRRLLPWQWFATEPKRKVQPPAGWDADDDKTASECDTDDEIEKVLRKQKKQRTDQTPSPQPTTSRESPKPHSSKNLSPKPHTSREQSPKPHSSREKSLKPHSSREKSPKPHSSREKSPKPHSSREKSPKPHSSREKSPKPHSSREKSPKPHSSREKSPKPHSSREKSPKPSSSKEKSRKRSRERSQSKESPKLKRNLNYSNMSSDSDVAFVKDDRIQANITIDSGDSTDEEKPAAKERIDKKCALPDFFDGYTFVIDDCVEDAGFDKELLSRYVKAYGGVVMNASTVELDSEISFVLSAGAGKSSNGLRVRADWLWRCHRDKQMCDVAEYSL